MNPPVKRRYASKLRQEQADITRSRILETAMRLFIERGYNATSIREVAQAAGVAVDTVYAVFGSKSGVLMAARETGERMGGVQRFDDLVSIDDPRELLGRVASISRNLGQQLGPLIRVVLQAAESDPKVAEVAQEGHRLRRIDMGKAAARLAALGALRPELDTEAATDILWALTGPALIPLAERPGWGWDRFETWFSEALSVLLLRRTG
jgi:AcrR family transcriptional regulator